MSRKLMVVSRFFMVVGRLGSRTGRQSKRRHFGPVYMKTASGGQLAK